MIAPHGPFLRVALLAGVAALAACDDRSRPSAPSPTASNDVKATSAPASPPANDAGAPIRIASRWGASSKVDVDPSTMLDPVYYSVLDGSGSMGDQACSSGRYKEGRIGDARDAAITYERSLAPRAKIGLFVFDAKGYGQRVAIGTGPDNRAAFESAVRDVRAGNSTPLGPAVAAGAAALEAAAERQGGYGSYHLVIETDGLPDSMPELTKAVDLVEQTPIILETVGFCIDTPDHPLRRPGETLYRNAQNPSDLMAGLKEMAAETDAFADAANDTGSAR